MKKKIYYAHSMHLYGTPQELRDIETLVRLGFEVINPSDPEMQKAFKEHDANNRNRDDYMDFFAEVVANCHAVAFRAHIDGSVPSGVSYEVKKGIELGKDIIELPNLLSRRFLDVEDTRLMLQYLGER